MLFRFGEFSDGTTETVFKSGIQLRSIDRGGLCLRLTRRQNDYVRYVRECTNIEGVFDIPETLSHLAWLTIGCPSAQLFTDEDMSVSTILTATDFIEDREAEEIPES